MIYKDVTFYCSDHHIEYHLQPLDQMGVGGEITARTRIAHALATRGHNITMYVNCPREEKIQGIDYPSTGPPGLYGIYSPKCYKFTF